MYSILRHLIIFFPVQSFQVFASRYLVHVEKGEKILIDFVKRGFGYLARVSMWVY